MGLDWSMARGVSLKSTVPFHETRSFGRAMISLILETHDFYANPTGQEESFEKESVAGADKCLEEL